MSDNLTYLIKPGGNVREIANAVLHLRAALDAVHLLQGSAGPALTIELAGQDYDALRIMLLRSDDARSLWDENPTYGQVTHRDPREFTLCGVRFKQGEYAR